MYQQEWRIEVPGFAVGGNIWDALGREKRLKFGAEGGRWCQVFEVFLGGLGLIKEIQSPCGSRGWAG